MDDDEKPRPGNFDRAWNDPPLFSYKPTAPGPNKLNKRVMHPVATAAQPPLASEPPVGPPRLHDAGAKSVEATNLPPPPPPSIGVGSNETNSGRKDENSGEQISQEDKAAAVNILKDLLKKLDPDLDQRKAADLAKRLETLESKMSDCSLNVSVEKGVIALASFVRDDNLDEAEKIQKKLMVDWPSQCGTWAVALKHLIFEARNRLKGAAEDPDS